MFTGIVKEIGTIEDIKPKGSTLRLTIRASGLSKEADIGDSISVNGICFTVADKSRDILHFDIMGETLKTTTAGMIKKREKVHLEPALELSGGNLSGHLVSGHIDEVGTIKKISRRGRDSIQVVVGASEKGLKLLVEKGSVAVNGVSLTVSGVGRDYFVIDLIPHTLKETTFGEKRIGDRLNIEFDVIGKYVQKNVSALKKKGLSAVFLKEHGFM